MSEVRTQGTEAEDLKDGIVTLHVISGASKKLEYPNDERSGASKKLEYPNDARSGASKYFEYPNDARSGSHGEKKSGSTSGAEPLDNTSKVANQDIVTEDKSDKKTGRNIIIIANNREHIPDIRKFPFKLGPDDLIVRFNKGLYPKDDTSYDNPDNLIVMFREHAIGISGIRADGKIESKRLRHAKEYYLVGGGLQPELMKKIEKKNNIKLGLLHTEVVKKTYGLEKTPSSGFIALVHFMVQKPDDRIILFGFSWEGWSGHNFKKERKIAKDLEAQGRLLIV